MSGRQPCRKSAAAFPLLPLNAGIPILSDLLALALLWLAKISAYITYISFPRFICAEISVLVTSGLNYPGVKTGITDKDGYVDINILSFSDRIMLK